MRDKEKKSIRLEFTEEQKKKLIKKADKLKRPLKNYLELKILDELPKENI